MGMALSALGCWALRRGDSQVGADTNTRSWTPVEVTSLPHLQLKPDLLEEQQEASPRGLGFLLESRTEGFILGGGGLQQETDLSGSEPFHA